MPCAHGVFFHKTFSMALDTAWNIAIFYKLFYSVEHKRNDSKTKMRLNFMSRKFESVLNYPVNNKKWNDAFDDPDQPDLFPFQ
jgi:hypothetical protein